MSYEDFQVKMEGYFLEQWALGPFSDLQVFCHDEETGEASQGQNTWLRLSFIPEIGNQIEMGNTVAESTARYESRMYIDVFSRAGRGLQSASMVADHAREIFRVRQLENNKSGLIRTRRPLARPLGNDIEGWTLLQVEVYYFRDVLEDYPVYVVSLGGIYIISLDGTILLEGNV